jgi:hypothetical protein
MRAIAIIRLFMCMTHRTISSALPQNTAMMLQPGTSIAIRCARQAPFRIPTALIWSATAA